MPRRGANHRWALLAAIALSQQACASRPVDPQLAAAVAPKTADEESVSGATLAQCFANAPRVAKYATPESVAPFSASATYKLAERMKKSPQQMAAHAGQLRAYAFHYEHTSLFGRRSLDRICIYGRTDAGLIYLSNVTADSEGGVRKEEVVGALVEAYEKLSGKSLSFGERALLIMSVPQY
jgi:hypothetical protein